MLRLKNTSFILLAVSMLFLLSACKAEEINYYTGTVESDRYTAMTSVSGKITEIAVNEGDYVELGQTLAVLETDALEIEKNRLESLLAGAQADLDRILKGAREEEVNQIRQQIEQQKDQISIFQDQLNNASTNYETIKSLYESGAAAKKQLDDMKLVLDNAVSKRDQAKSLKAQLEENLNLVLKGAAEEELTAAQSRVDSAKWAVESVKDKIEDALIQANHSGTVETIYFKKGEQYPALSKFTDIADSGNLKVRIYIEDMNLHKVRIGDMVKIKVDFDAGLDLTGTVEYISSEGEFTPKNLESKENRQEVVYETRIRIDNPDGRLKSGMLVDIYLGDDLNDQ